MKNKNMMAIKIEIECDYPICVKYVILSKPNSLKMVPKWPRYALQNLQIWGLESVSKENEKWKFNQILKYQETNNSST